MNPEEILRLTAALIACKSLTFHERPVFELFHAFATSLGLPSKLLPLGDARANLLIQFGTPKILFSTHLDVVDAPEELFIPRREGNTLFGRGACDAKGIAATMLAAVKELALRGGRDFALLLVSGEEIDGLGARTAAQEMRGRGVEYLINGEPTMLRLVTAHKGSLNVNIKVRGRSAHSGYPERGDDANRALVELCQRLYGLNYGEDAELGRATINIGEIRGGIGSNVVSPHAEAFGLVRTVRPTEETIELIRQQLGDRAEVELLYGVDPVRCVRLPGFECEVASYCTDIPNFSGLGAKPLLFGPGTIHCAHTDHESITLEDVERGKAGYIEIYDLLKAALDAGTPYPLG